MKLLLDTHALLWFLEGSDKLSSHARGAIEAPGSQLLFSAAGAWEIAVKVGLGKLRLNAPFEEIIPRELQSNGIRLLPIRPDHMRVLIELPFHHRDPFDRMMVAQAVVERAVMVSADVALDAYGIPRLWDGTL